MKIEKGTKLGHYEILSQIGAGGMGEVYLAEDTKLHRKLALKVLPAEVASNQERMRRFHQEAIAAAALNHPNIAHVYEIGETDGVHFIAMEFIDGVTLREKIHRDHPDLRKLLRYLEQVAKALARAHSAGIVHRDLKPENIMITRDGYAKVLDFGLAKLTEQRAHSGAGDSPGSDVVTAILPQQSTPGTVLGTAGYMSPEQAQGRTDEIDHRSDIFSFGCILFEAATGQKAFDGKDAIDSLHKIIHSPAPQISEFNPGAPAELQRIVRRCLAKEADKRYQSIGDVAIELEELRQEMKAAADLDSSVDPASAASTSTASAATISSDSSAASVSGSTQTTAAPTISSAEYIVSQVRQHKFGVVLILTLAVLIIAGAGYGIYKFSGRSPTNISFESARITRLTNSGKVVTAAISPDGKWLVYADSDGDQQSLWFQQVAVSGSNTQIVPPSGGMYLGLAFSPDGNYVYYTVTGDAGTSYLGSLYQVPVPSGTPRKLFTGISGRVSFSPDGKQIAYYVYDNGEEEDRLMIANADGTGQRQLATRRGNEYFSAFATGPSWSADGKTIVTTVGTYNPRKMSVAAVSVETGEITFFCPQKFGWAGEVTWLADGKSVMLLADERPVPSTGSVWQISYPSGETKKISDDLNEYSGLSLTADSNVLAAVHGTNSAFGTNSWTLPSGITNIWTAPINDMARASPATSGSDRNYFPSWTPDGKIVYVTDSGGLGDLYIVDPRGGNPRKLTADSGLNYLPAVSPDGRYIVFTSDRAGTPSLWRIDIDGSNPKQLTSGNDTHPSISPDGREVIYTSETNKPTVWKVGIDGGPPVQLTDMWSSVSIFSPDGKQFVCSYSENGFTVLWAIFASAGGTPLKTFPQVKGLIVLNPRWMPDGRSILYGVNRGGVTNFWIQPIDGGEPKQLTNFTSDVIQSFDISRDGKQIAFTKRTGTSDVVLITGFRK